jgi:formylglycine-generating enzyme required for sulfatase activity
MVPGGTVALDASHTATVSDYELDKYEVTVGRFRAFVDAWVGGWRPEPGSGKHTHLSGGTGLSNGSDGYEPGWDTAWSASLASTTLDWDANLSCSGKYQSWTSSAAGNERRPINCATWFEMAAFCTWDGGFLPSEAEWQYAAAGGSENRLYPWGAAEPMNTLAVFCGGSCESSENVGSHPDGNGRWGHSDLAGNVWEWALDGYQTPYPLSMTTNYANMMSMGRVIRSGSFSGSASDLLTSLRSGLAPSVRNFDLGARCARVP